MSNIHGFKTEGMEIKRPTRTIEVDLSKLTEEEADAYLKELEIMTIKVKDKEGKEQKFYLNVVEWELNRRFYEYKEYEWSLGLEIMGCHSPEEAAEIALKKYPEFTPPPYISPIIIPTKEDIKKYGIDKDE